MQILYAYGYTFLRLYRQLVDIHAARADKRAAANTANEEHRVRYLVTGGAGFIGSHLTDALLATGHQVRVLDDLSTGTRENVPPGAEFCHADVADTDAVAAAMADTSGCFHLAAVASVQRATEDWAGVHRTNLGGTIAVLDGARKHGGLPVVYASSAAVYGDLAGAIATEYARCAPQTAYGADKLGSELHAAVAWRVHGIATMGLRFFNVYGPRQDPSSPYSGVISIFAARLAAGLPITRHGDGMQTRDFIHVSDVVTHVLAAMRTLAGKPGAHVLNVCTGRETSIAELAAILGDLTGRPPVVRPGAARPGDIGRSVGDPGRAWATLGVAAGIELRQGLQALVPGRALAGGATPDPAVLAAD
jgi:UDP-glucose 4-epimerase